MLSRQELHRLRGPAQMREEEIAKMIEYIRSFGIMSGQPRDTFVEPLSPFRDFVYLTETRRADVAEMPNWVKHDGPIQDWYNWSVGSSGPEIKTAGPNPPNHNPNLEDVILAVNSFNALEETNVDVLTRDFETHERERISEQALIGQRARKALISALSQVVQ